MYIDSKVSRLAEAIEKNQPRVQQKLINILHYVYDVNYGDKKVAEYCEAMCLTGQCNGHNCENCKIHKEHMATNEALKAPVEVARRKEFRQMQIAENEGHLWKERRWRYEDSKNNKCETWRSENF